MKLLIILITSCSYTFSQYNNVYQKMFDKTKNYRLNHLCHLNIGELYNGTYYFGDVYGDGLSMDLDALLLMYEKTSNVEYLNDFVKCANKVISNRDDFRGVNLSQPYWSSHNRFDNGNNCPGPITYETGLILWPLSHFIYLEKKVYNSLFSTLNVTSLIGNKTFNNDTINTFQDFSNWLYLRVKETESHYNNYYWKKDLGYHQYASNDPCNNFANKENIEGTDRQMNWGCALIYLSLAFENTLNSDFSEYFDKVQTIAYMHRKYNIETSNLAGNAPTYKWFEEGWTNFKINNPDNFSHNSINPDDISHGSAAIEFMYLCNKFKSLIKSNPGGVYPNGYFTDYDMKCLANNMIYLIYHDPLKFHNDIIGGNYSYNYSQDFAFSIGNFPGPFALHRWLTLSNSMASYYYNNTTPLYYMLSDIYSLYLENPNYANEYQSLLGFAYSYTFQKTFCFLGRNSTPGGSHDDDWQGVSSGDFNNDGKKNEFIAVRNSNGGFYFYSVNNNSTQYNSNPYYGVIDYTNVGMKIIPKGSYISGGVSTGVDNSLWKGITCAHFTNEELGDQIATIRNSDGKIFVWKPTITNSNYSVASIVSGTNEFCPTKNWSGITSSDIDGDGIAEISAIRDDGTLFIWNVSKNGNNFKLKVLFSSNMGGSQWSAISSGDIDNDGKNEIISVRNSDGLVFVWNFSKNIFGQFVLNSTVIDSTYQASNNLWNGIVVGDFNSDGKIEFILHRNSDGAFFTNFLSTEGFKHIATDYFPVNQDLKVFGTCKIGSHNKDVFLSLRNYDGDIMLYSLDYSNNFPKSISEEDKTSHFEYNSTNIFKIYPNPTKKSIVLESDLLNSNYLVYNIHGQVITGGIIKDIKTFIDVSDLLNGIYFVKFICNTGIYYSKFLKN